MLTLDGGTGGGQLLRTALSLSVLTGTAFELEHIRAARPSPGLRPQHLAAVRVMRALGTAEVSGAEPGSERLTFRPESFTPDPMSVAIGTAGSVTLLFDTVLALATQIDDPFDLTATGGTDVKWAPTIGYLDRVKRELLGQYGLDFTVALERTGFYPVGGGLASVRLAPSTLEPIVLDRRGDVRAVTVSSKASADLADAEVAERQATRAIDRLEAEGLPVTIDDIESVETESTGSSILLRAQYDHSLAGFDELGERGKPSEAVADDAVDQFLEFHAGAGAVESHLADQLLLPLALAGGSVLAPRLTDHIESNVHLISAFGLDMTVHERDGGAILVESD